VTLDTTRLAALTDVLADPAVPGALEQAVLLLASLLECESLVLEHEGREPRGELLRLPDHRWAFGLRRANAALCGGGEGPPLEALQVAAHLLDSALGLSEDQERLRRSEELLRQTGSLARVGGWELAVPGNTVFCTDELYRLLDIAPRPFLTRQEAISVHHPTARALMLECFGRCESAGTPFEVVVPMHCAAGRAPRWLRVMGQAEQRDGRVVRIFGASQDVTAQHLAREEALAASRSKSQFLANVSHEVRTPLNGIIGMTQLVLETALSDEQREYLEAVNSSGQNLLSIVNDILDVSKIESGKFELEVAAFDLQRSVADVVRNHAVRARERGLSVVAEFAADVCRYAIGDGLRLAQVLTNLVGNAVKFTTAGNVVVTVDRGAGDELCFAVRDTGPGVPAERREAIFEAFTQADGSTSRRFGGTGLGLTISRELVQRMGGKLWLESTVGVGSTFHFTLPLPPASEQKVKPRGGELTPLLLRAPVPLSVLMAEDNPINARLVKRMLEKLGHRVLHATNGREAVELFHRGGIDVILMDLQMPELDGLEATRLIRAAEAQRGGHLPIIALTANAMKGDDAQCFEAGMDGYLTKPLQREKLELELARCLVPRAVPPADLSKQVPARPD
jgi:signal transduction histidine kinase/ActR/RegA family two-component response regulator